MCVQLMRSPLSTAAENIPAEDFRTRGPARAVTADVSHVLLSLPVSSISSSSAVYLLRLLSCWMDVLLLTSTCVNCQQTNRAKAKGQGGYTRPQRPRQVPYLTRGRRTRVFWLHSVKSITFFIPGQHNERRPVRAVRFFIFFREKTCTPPYLFGNAKHAKKSSSSSTQKKKRKRNKQLLVVPITWLVSQAI